MHSTIQTLYEQEERGQRLEKALDTLRVQKEMKHLFD